MSSYVSLLLVYCQPLANPSNGMNNCSSGGSYPPGRFCTITCSSGYHGSGTRICQNDGSWNGSNICIREYSSFSHMLSLYAKQKPLGCKNRQGQQLSDYTYIAMHVTKYFDIS